MIDYVSIVLSLIAIIAIVVVTFLIVKRLTDIEADAKNKLNLAVNKIKVSLSNAAASDAIQQTTIDAMSARIQSMSKQITTDNLDANTANIKSNLRLQNGLTVNGGGVVLDGKNKWSFHAPDIGNAVHIMPWENNNWSQSAAATFQSDGMFIAGSGINATNLVLRQGMISSASNIQLSGGKAVQVTTKDGLVVSKSETSSGNISVEGTIQTPTLQAGSITGVIKVDSGKNRLHLGGEADLFLLNEKGTVVSKAWGGTGNLTVEGRLSTGSIEDATNIRARSNLRLSISGDEDLHMLNKKGVVVSKAWGGNGNLIVDNNVTVGGQLCLNDVCVSKDQLRNLIASSTPTPTPTLTTSAARPLPTTVTPTPTPTPTVTTTVTPTPRPTPTPTVTTTVAR
jgi:hypothetical protein